MFSLINGWINNRESGDLRRYRAHYDVTVIQQEYPRNFIGLITSLYSGASTGSFDSKVFFFNSAEVTLPEPMTAKICGDLLRH